MLVLVDPLAPVCCWCVAGSGVGGIPVPCWRASHRACLRQPPHHCSRSPRKRVRQAHVLGSLVRLTRVVGVGVALGPATGSCVFGVCGGTLFGGAAAVYSILAATLYPGNFGASEPGRSFVSCSTTMCGFSFSMRTLSSGALDHTPLQLSWRIFRSSGPWDSARLLLRLRLSPVGLRRRDPGAGGRVVVVVGARVRS